MFRYALILGFLSMAAAPACASEPAKPTERAEAFFEKQILPLLAQHCIPCHGEKKQKGRLRLDARAALLQGGETGPALAPGKADDSLLIKAVRYHGELKMPPTGKLAEADIGKLQRWVDLGAPWPGKPKGIATAGDKFQITEAQRRWWAFQPIQPLAPPTVKNVGLVRTEIDRFILKRLESLGLSLAPQADRRTLLRRATFDLTGLPPTTEDVEAFIGDPSPQAFAKVVERLLASPAYGQRWARHWLDVARYADYHDGNPKARTASCEPLEAWRYRDWVVEAFQRDMPFDQFIVHQIAGDLLPSPEGKEIYPAGLIATTFLSNGVWDRGDACKDKIVSDMVQDQIDTIGQAFMGLTLGCARCHHHKFDPVSQEDYYALAGIFYSTHILKDLGPRGGEYVLNRVPLVPQSYLTKREAQTKHMKEFEAKLAKLPKDDPGRGLLLKQRDQLQAELLPAPPVAEAAQEGGTTGGMFPKIQDVPLHIRGSFTRFGPVIPRRLPEFFAGEKQKSITQGSGRRELANWVASRDHPLTARVLVNRVWSWHFGTGLVRTPNNFGMLSEPPTHPELLDWLALRFMEDGWSIKKLHRRIMLSAVYQQASKVPPEVVAKDPDNRWLGRFAPRRLEAEAIRDAMLAVAGKLDLALTGPASADVHTTRRSLYVQTARWDRGSLAILFDAANPDASEEKRTVSTVAPQALFLLNHEFVLTQAKEVAKRLLRDVPKDETARLQRAFHLLFTRPARAEEIRICRQILEDGNVQEERRWTDLAHVLLCSNEFVFID